MKKLYYKSTRGSGGRVSSAEAIVRGIAEDGGLYVPVSVPALDVPLKELLQLNYHELAVHILSLFLTDFDESEIKAAVAAAYDSKFDSPKIAPLVKKGGAYFLELFHGPTLAFKDMALAILPYLMKIAVRKLGINKEIVILTATSGDTGKAALEGFADVPGTRIVVYFPEHGVSRVQKLQMVTQAGNNTHVVGIQGNFDDAQTGVKNIFSDSRLAERMAAKNLLFSSANSINIGRLVPQVAYYFFAYLQVCALGGLEPGEEINFVVPTGNFGNILAGFYARCMGLPVARLVSASNENKVLYDFFRTGVYDREREFFTTMSPSMDILVSSNLERLLYMISGEDPHQTARLMAELAGGGRYRITAEMKEQLGAFFGSYATEAETSAAIRSVFDEENYIIDTHTAVAYAAWQKYLSESGDKRPAVVVSTASPYKFPRDVMTSIDSKYANEDEFSLIREMGRLARRGVPGAVDSLEARPVLHNKVCRKDEMKQVLEEILGLQ